MCVTCQVIAVVYETEGLSLADLPAVGCAICHQAGATNICRTCGKPACCKCFTDTVAKACSGCAAAATAAGLFVIEAPPAAVGGATAAPVATVCAPPPQTPVVDVPPAAAGSTRAAAATGDGQQPEGGAPVATDTTAPAPRLEMAPAAAEGEAPAAAVEEVPPSPATPKAVESATAAVPMSDTEDDTVPMLLPPPGP